MATDEPDVGFTLGALASQHGCELAGDPDVRVISVATLAGAAAGQLSFLANPKYRPYLANCAASAVVVHESDVAGCPTNALIAADPYVTYARIAAVLHPSTSQPAGIDPTASVHPSAVVADSAHVAAGAVIESGARVGARAVIGPNSTVGRHADIGDDAVLVAAVCVRHGCVVGRRATLHPGCVIGSDGFGYARDPDGWIKVPQVGRVVLGDDVDVGANTTIDRGAVDDTVIGDGVKLDNQIQIGHNVRIGAHTIIAACSGVSGSTVIGARCLIAGAVGFVGHLNICDDVTVTGQTMVNRSIDEPGVYSSALPMDTASRWRKNSARFRRLDDLARTVKRLEKTVAALTDAPTGDADRAGKQRKSTDD